MVEAIPTTVSSMREIEFLFKKENIAESVSDKFKASFLELIKDVDNEAKLYNIFVT